MSTSENDMLAPLMAPPLEYELEFDDMMPTMMVSTMSEDESQSGIAPSMTTPRMNALCYDDTLAQLTSTPLGKVPPNSALTTPDMKSPSGASSTEVRSDLCDSLP